VASVVGISHDAEFALISPLTFESCVGFFHDCFKASCDARAYVRPSSPPRADAGEVQAEHVSDVLV